MNMCLKDPVSNTPLNSLISDQDLSAFNRFNVCHVDFCHVYSRISMLYSLTEVNIFILTIPSIWQSDIKY